MEAKTKTVTKTQMQEYRALRAKISKLLEEEAYPEAMQEVEVLREKFGDADAYFAMMIQAAMDEDYIKALQISAFIMKNEYASLSPRFYFAMYLNASILKLIDPDKRTEQINKIIAEETELCDAWFKTNGFEMD